MEWCKESEDKPVNKRAFGVRLTERGFGDDRGTGGVRIRSGLCLRDMFASDTSDRSDIDSHMNRAVENSHEDNWETASLTSLTSLDGDEGEEVPF